MITLLIFVIGMIIIIPVLTLKLNRRLSRQKGAARAGTVHRSMFRKCPKNLNPKS